MTELKGTEPVVVGLGASSVKRIGQLSPPRSIRPRVRRLRTWALVSLRVLFMLSCAGRPVDASPITFQFSGVWTMNDILLVGPVQPGDTFIGSFSYDPAAAMVSFHRNGSVSGEVTDYLFGLGGARIELDVTTSTGIVPFRSYASAMGAEVWDNFSDALGSPASDRFYLQSFGLGVFPPFYQRGFERLDIDIVGLALVDSTALPLNLTIPSIGYAIVNIQGGSSSANLDFNDRGTMTTLTQAPEPGTLGLLSSGLTSVLIHGWCRRRRRA